MHLAMRLLVVGRGLLWRVLKPLTVGVRLIMAEGQRVLLVQHTHDALWYLPGGGVRKGETLEQAIRREAREELNGGTSRRLKEYRDWDGAPLVCRW